MKKILTVFAALAMVAGLASSCQKEGASTDNHAQGKLVNVKLTAAFEGDSKVTYSETDNILTPAWEMDDAILVINPSVDPSTLTVTSIDGDGYATLEGTAEPGLVHLVYKKGITTGDWQGNKIDVDYDEQKVNDDMPAVMFADGQVSSNGSGSFQFRNAGAVIGIYNAKGVPAGSAISKVTLSGSNLSAATVSINGDALVLTATEKAKDAISTETLSDITVTTGETRALSEEILIAVPAGAKVEKVTLTVGEDTYSYTLAAAKTCNANDYLYVKTQEFKKDVVTTGTAKATIGGSEVDVNWVQLWENGPKFAEYNVGASSATDAGSTMTFTEAKKTGSDYVWGANWCTPSKDDLNELLNAATYAGSEKVTCFYRQENSQWGFKFTGKEEGYTDNSVFFPVQQGDGYYGDAEYLSVTADGGEGWIMSPRYDSGEFCSHGYSDYPGSNCLVRPVLKN